MTTETRPLGFGDLDRNGTNQYPDNDIPASLNGYPNLAIPLAREFNTLGRQWSSWVRLLDQQAPRTPLLSAGATSLLSAGPLSYAPAGGLTHAVVADSTYMVEGYVADLPKSRLATMLLDPYTFTANRWHHFYVGRDGAVTVGIVNIGVAASAPAGYVHVGTGETDAIDLIDYIFATGLTSRRWDLALRVRVENVADEEALEIVGAGSAAPALRVTNTDGGGGLVINIGTSVAAAFKTTLVGAPAGASVLRATADATSAAPLLNLDHAGTGDAVSITKAGTGRALYLTLSGAATATEITHGGSGRALSITHSGTATEAASITASNDTAALSVSGAGLGHGLRAEGGASAQAAVIAVSNNPAGQGFRAQTSGVGTTASRAAYLEGRNLGAGAEILAASNNGLIVRGNATHAAIRLAGQPSRQVINVGGELGYADDEDQLVVGSVAGSARGVWTTSGGKVTANVAPYNGFSSAVTTTGGGSWVIAAAFSATGPDAPKRVGSLYLRFRCQPRNIAAVMSANALNVRLVDVTANPAVAIAGSTRSGIGTGDTAGFTMPALDTSWQGVVDYVFRVSVPAAGDRSWRAEVQPAGASDIRVRDCVLSVVDFV